MIKYKSNYIRRSLRLITYYAINKNLFDVLRTKKMILSTAKNNEIQWKLDYVICQENRLANQIERNLLFVKDYDFFEEGELCVDKVG